MLDTWVCHICKATRPDAAISVLSTDLSNEFNSSPGTFRQNVRYCNDRETCIEGAKTKRLINKLQDHIEADMTLHELRQERQSNG